MLETTDRSAAVMIVNEMHAQYAGLARAAVEAFRDKKISTFEGINLALKATMLASATAAIVERSAGVEMADVLYVLEHGRVVLD